jgi:tetratricopeptide (TPR) repeat protein
MGVSSMATAIHFNNLGTTLRQQGNWAEAAQAFESALSLQPENPEFAYNLAVALHKQGQLDRAAVFYRQASRLKPEYPAPYVNLATLLKEQGVLDEAVALLREALRLQPFFALAYYNLSEFVADGRYEFGSDELERMNALMTAEHRPALERSLAAFGLAAARHKQCHYDDAFACYERANSLRKSFNDEQQAAFDAQGHEALIDRTIATFDPAYFTRTQGWGLDTGLPIFIIGMPRSGSTLVEQILASHRQVFGAGEIGDISRFVTQFAAKTNVSLSSACLPHDQNVARDIAAAYLEAIAQLGTGATRVTVKTLQNFLHLGVIATLLPHARVIHCKREPIDVCLSCYFTNFQNVDFAWSLADIGAYHRAYEKLMVHWSRVLPLPIHEVRYEELVHNQESATRELLAFCDLDWDERCLAFWDTRRVVQTASAVQVRKPISSQAIGRWRHYRSHLGPLFKALGRADLVHEAEKTVHGREHGTR